MMNQIAKPVKRNALAVAFIASVVSFTVFADAPSITRIFRAPKLTRGNTNIIKSQPIDDAAWVWMPGDSGIARI